MYENSSILNKLKSHPVVKQLEDDMRNAMNPYDLVMRVHKHKVHFDDGTLTEEHAAYLQGIFFGKLEVLEESNNN